MMFKVGDKVKCIDNIWTGNILDINGVYTVKSYKPEQNGYDGLLFLIEKPGSSGFYVSRFIKYNEVLIQKEEDYYEWLAKR